jgi:TRAP-type C4-dicarboxylate transport system permease small subunit
MSDKEVIGMKILENLTRILGRITATAAAVAAVAVAFLALVVSLSFISRTAFGLAIPGLIEFGETLMVLAVFLGLAYGERTQSQIRMTLITEYSPPAVATTLRLIAMLIATGLVTLFAVATSATAWDSFQEGEFRFGLLQFPLWPARAVIAFGFWLLALEYLLKGGHYLLDLVTKNYATYDYGIRQSLKKKGDI